MDFQTNLEKIKKPWLIINDFGFNFDERNYVITNH